RDQILAVGTHQQQLALRKAEYDQAVRLHGADSKAAIDAQTALIREEQQKDKASRAGGAAKLSDQQKLQNQLSAGQTTYNNKTKDAEAAHQQRLLDIQTQFDEKMREAQRAFTQASLDDRLGFYSSLSSIEDAGLQKAMSGKFEEATLKSQQ